MTNFVCIPEDGPAILPARWFVEEYATRIDPMHYHYLGPFNIVDEDSVSDWTGVSNCMRWEYGSIRSMGACGGHASRRMHP